MPRRRTVEAEPTFYSWIDRSSSRFGSRSERDLGSRLISVGGLLSSFDPNGQHMVVADVCYVRVFVSPDFMFQGHTKSPDLN